MEKYTRVYHFDGQFYVEKSPVILLAGAILKDNYNGEVIAQLKFKSISKKNIKAIKVDLVLFDASGKEQEKVASHQYLDLNIERNKEFGSQEPIKIPYSDTRSFKVVLKEVIYIDGEIWSNDNKEWTSIIAPKQLSTILTYDEINLFRNKYSIVAQYIPKKQSDLWHCTCGMICYDNESTCPYCGFSQKMVDNINFEEIKKETLYNISLDYLDTYSITKLEQAKTNFSNLKDYKDSKDRLEECTKKIEKVKNDIDNIKSKAKKVSIKAGIIIAILALIIGVVLFITKVLIPSNNYKKALEYKENGQYIEAIEQLKKLPNNYKDASELLNEYHISYANVLTENNQYEDAIKQLKELSDDYPNAKDILKKCYVSYSEYLKENKEYQKALEIYDELNYANYNKERLDTIYKYALDLMENEKYEEAYNNFVLSEEYNDSKDKAKEAAKKFADKFLKEKNYEDALKWYTTAEDKKGINKVKYDYVKDHYKADDMTTYEYLVDLAKAKYSDALNLYHKLYNVKATIVINTSKDDNKSAPTTVRQDSSYKDLYGHYKVTGNIPGGKANIKTVYETRWGYDNVVKEGWKKNTYFTYNSIKVNLNKWESTHLDMASNLYYHRVKIYNADTGELLATSATVYTPYYR